MSLAPLPANEPARLAVVNAYAIPDAPHARRLDVFPRLASRACSAPISVLTLIGEDRVFCKSTFGISPFACERRRALCAYTILRPGEVTVSEDASQDERFRDSLMVQGAPHARFFVSAPICNQEGIPLGALSVIDKQRRPARADELDTLSRLADGAACVLEYYRGALHRGFAPYLRPPRHQADADPPASEWELISDWLAHTHSECGRQTTDAWVPHYVRHCPKLVERLMIEAGQLIDIGGRVP